VIEVAYFKEICLQTKLCTLHSVALVVLPPHKFAEGYVGVRYPMLSCL